MYKVEISFSDGRTEELEEVFETEAEARSFGDQWCSDYHQGGEVLLMAAGVDPDESDDDELDVYVIELPEDG
jgi:hypothetical protein